MTMGRRSSKLGEATHCASGLRGGEWAHDASASRHRSRTVVRSMTRALSAAGGPLHHFRARDTGLQVVAAAADTATHDRLAAQTPMQLVRTDLIADAGPPCSPGTPAVDWPRRLLDAEGAAGLEAALVGVAADLPGVLRAWLVSGRPVRAASAVSAGPRSASG